MKKSILTLALMISVNCLVKAQTTTNFGTSSGTLGTSNSFFGYYSGSSATGTSSNNAFFGDQSGQLTTTGTYNTAIGSRAFNTNTTGSGNSVVGTYSLYYNTSGSNNVAFGNSAMLSNTTGNANTVAGTSALSDNTTGANNAAFGYEALKSNTTASDNVAIGHKALYNNSTGSQNIAIGNSSLFTNNAGVNNTAVGYGTMYYSTGDHNSAYGAYALSSNSSGSYNSAHGNYALTASTTGANNTAVGYQAGSGNTSGSFNSAFGFAALRNSSTASYNTALGIEALWANNTGTLNVATGHQALYSNTTGYSNTSAGYRSLYSNSSGQDNVALGDNALYNNTTGNGNTSVGKSSGPSANNFVNTSAFGFQATTTASNQVRIGNSSVTSIGGQVGWTTLSDGRFKLDVKEDVSGLNFINGLRPVSYSLNRKAFNTFVGVKEELASNQSKVREKPLRHTGFVAQEVEELVKKTGYVFHGVDAPKNDKDYYGIRYEEFVVPLVKALQELSQKVEEQQEIIKSLLLKEDETVKSIGNAQGAILHNNNPNPFSNDTEIKMTLPETIQQANLIVYNMEGKQLKSLVINARGEAAVKISANELGAGMYLYTLIADGKFINTKRMILTK